MLMILTCKCRINELREKETPYECYLTFGECQCEVEHTITATICPIHYLNVTGFARSFFASVKCNCLKMERNEICKHCKSLEIALNVNVKTVCVKKEDLPADLKFVHFDKYSERKLSGDQIFIYDPIENCICTRLDSIDWMGFFIGKETLQF